MTEPVAGAASQAPAAAQQPAAAQPGQQPAAGANNQQPAKPDNILAQLPAGGEGEAPKLGADGKPIADPANPAGDAPEGGEGDAAPAYDDALIDNLKLPENFEATEVFDAFKTLAKDLKLPPEKAQEITDLGAKLSDMIQQKTQQAWVDLNAQWQKEVKADPEIGGKNFDNMKATIGKALDSFGDAKTREAFIMTGAGNNPAIIKFLYGMAQAVTESGGMVRGGATNTEPKTVGQTLYPNMKSA